MLLYKVLTVGNSKAVVIPAQFFEYWMKQGKKIDEVGMEIDGEIIIRPIFKNIQIESRNNLDFLSDIKTNIDRESKEENK